MEKLLEKILVDTSNGKINKSTAIDLITMLKEEKHSNDDIAIIGIGFRFPFANNLGEFWDVIRGRFDCIRSFPNQRKKDIDNYLNYIDKYDNNRTYLDGSFLDRIDYFDNELFNITPNEARLMDPYQRLFLQIAWETIEDSGIGTERIKNTRTGVYVGCASNIKDCYQNFILNCEKESIPISIASNIPAMIPARISYLLNLKGPAITIDTACSSSLISIYQGCAGIKNGDCDLAIAGAIKLHTIPVDDDIYKIGIEASDGRTRAFDDKSDGSGFGEGVAAVLLKPLSKALQDNDNIYAVIKGGAINQDGKSMGITAPNPIAHKDVLVKAWKNSQIDPSNLSFIETHGTGTSLGDPIEVQGINEAFLEFTSKKQFCAISSVKSNIGHLYECAGMASIVKAILCLQNRAILPTNHFNTPNMKIDFADSPVYVNSKVRNLESLNKPMICGVSSFGFSGTNCHLILEEKPGRNDANEIQLNSDNILPLSAGSLDGLMKLVERYKEFFETNKEVNLSEVCYTASLGRCHHRFRIAIIVKEINDANHKLGLIKKENVRSLQKYEIFFGDYKLIKRNEKTKEYELTIEEKKEIDKLAAMVGNSEKLKLCEYYVKGADINWGNIFQDKKVRKLSIPTYPFTENRFWLDIKESVEEYEEKFFYETKWKLDEILNDTLSSPSNEKVIIFSDGTKLSKEIKEILEEKSNVVYEYNIQESLDYRKLFQKLDLNDISTIINICNSSFQDTDEIVTIFKELEYTELKRKIRFIGIGKNAYKVTNNDRELIPYNMLLLSLISTFRMESDNIISKSIDIDELATAEQIIKLIYRENDNSLMALRAGGLYTEELSEKNVEFLEDNFKVKENGVYIITGGTGGIGLEIAKYLSSINNVNIALLNRNNIFCNMVENKEKIQIIDKINKSGSIAKVFQVNIDDEMELNNILIELREEFGSINGIFHCAGIASKELLKNKSIKQVSKVISPKVNGAILLDKLTEKDNMDFMVLCSSICVSFGGPYQLDYIAANSFLNSFAYWRENKGKRTISINWATWKEVGMSVKNGFNIDTIFRAIDTKNAISCLDKILKSNEVNLIVGEINLKKHYLMLLEKSKIKLSKEINKLIKDYLSENKEKSGVIHKNDTLNITGNLDGKYNEVEVTLANIIYKVLGIKEINLNDNFFELGADSILIKRIHQEINDIYIDKISITDMFQYPTIKQLYDCIIKNESDKEINITSAEAEVPMDILEEVNTEDKSLNDSNKDNKTEYYLLSSQQKRQFILNCLDSKTTNYNISKVLILDGKLDLNRLDYVLKKVMIRHEALRSSFHMINGEPMQKIHNKVDFKIEYDAINGDEDVDKKIAESIKPFILEVPPLIRIKIINLAVDKNMMVFDMHHIIGDGESINVLMQDIARLYAGDKLPELRFQYKDYVEFQSKFNKSKRYNIQEEFWINMHKNKKLEKSIFTDYERGDQLDYRGSRIYKSIDRNITKGIKSIAVNNNSTLFMVLLATFSLVVSEYYDDDDVAIGTPIISRPNKEFDEVVGIFVNTLAIRMNPNKDKSFKDYLIEVKKICIDAFENQDYQFDNLTDKLKVRRELNKNPLFDVFFSLQNIGVKNFNLESINATAYDYQSNSSRFDISIDILEENEELSCILEYKTSLFNKETIDIMFNNYQEILSEVVTNSSIKIGDIKVLSNNTKVNKENSYDFTFNF
ncbi:hypothetical protein GCM10008904_21260 [Paraclostridium ghonii]|uniref:3-oxoacyl-(Acyl-carrier-protein) synthase/acyl carrier protein n=1 Tax=Paraclostridium ghonii TaxID=29358 RepID=A0ABU0N033_9FIRM|nr:SDR family NAD(P)-dependent oxidoreductase [Paeniclostridium ghonii]MDQ0556518.1 3-oxoacyl-(acyl-carrier-protein) synthase/acyl carrier protein [Paeniclostridium ghonii]